MEAFHQPPSNYTFGGSDRSVGGEIEDSPLKPVVSGAMHSRIAAPAPASPRSNGGAGSRVNSTSSPIDGKADSSQLLLGAGGLENAILASESFTGEHQHRLVPGVGAMAIKEGIDVVTATDSQQQHPKNGPAVTLMTEKQKTNNIEDADQEMDIENANRGAVHRGSRPSTPRGARPGTFSRMLKTDVKTKIEHQSKTKTTKQK